MFEYKDNTSTLSVDFKKGGVSSLTFMGRELIADCKSPLFTINMMDCHGNTVKFNTFDAKTSEETGNCGTYSGFAEDITVKVICETKGQYFAEWKIAIDNNSDKLVEWIDFMDIPLAGKLVKNGGDGKMLFPYCEGVVIDDIKTCERHFPEPSYPSIGSTCMFPHVVFSQFLAYNFGENGLYIGAHDEKRGLKWIAFPEIDGTVTTKIRMYPGLNYGENYETDFPYVWDFYKGDWYDGAEIYRKWLYKNLPYGLDFIKNTTSIPDWYKNMPLVIIYPIRGKHDTDVMNPNDMYPYANAMPLIREISEATGAQTMPLLMHWEGTAPWAPPYVWPPYGGEEEFNKFADILHQEGHLLGVYCSGIGWTSQSHTLPSYNMDEVFEKNNYREAMCLAPDGSLPLGRICTDQRTGYDLCPESEVAQKIIAEAYTPLLKSKVDYAQILDQNNGGNSYFCYSKDHGHPPAPGLWQIESMNKLMDGWNKIGDGKIIGCETAAAEPFLKNLMFNDNRFEFCFAFGENIPLYGYLYHEFLHNFMGNQCGCPLQGETLAYRMAYSFSAGDNLSVVISHDQKISKNWGNVGPDSYEDKEKILKFVRNLTDFYKEKGKDWLYDGKMIKPTAYTCTYTTYTTMEYTNRGSHPYYAEDVVSTAWENNGKKMQMFINHTTDEKTVTLADGSELQIPALDVVMIEI